MVRLTPPQDTEVSELLAAMGLLIRRMRSEVKAGEISWSQMAILARLEAEPMTTADLARAEAMKPQSMGTALAQMEEEGLVRRKRHPTDGRQILYEITRAGAQGRYVQRLAKREWLLAAVGNLGRDDQQKLFAATDVIRGLAES